MKSELCFQDREKTEEGMERCRVMTGMVTAVKGMGVEGELRS